MRLHRKVAFDAALPTFDDDSEYRICVRSPVNVGNGITIRPGEKVVLRGSVAINFTHVIVSAEKL